ELQDLGGEGKRADEPDDERRRPQIEGPRGEDCAASAGAKEFGDGALGARGAQRGPDRSGVAASVPPAGDRSRDRGRREGGGAAGQRLARLRDRGGRGDTV